MNTARRNANNAAKVMPTSRNGKATSHSSGRPIVFGWTSTGKYLMICYEDVPAGSPTVFPVTAYEVMPPAGRKRQRRKKP